MVPGNFLLKKGGAGRGHQLIGKVVLREKGKKWP